MVDDVGALSVRLQATAARFEADMQRATRSMERAAARMDRRAGRLDQRLSSVGERFGLNIPTRAAAVGAAIGGIALAIRGVIKAGEQMKLLEGRFNALTGSASRSADIVKGVFATSAVTGDAINAVGSLTQRFILSAEALKVADSDVSRFTESLLKLGRIGGSSASEISNGTTQLSQALAGGIVRAEEFNSILENTPMIAKAIADGFGVGIGELRKMVLEGKLLSRDVFNVILQQTDKIDKAFQEIPQTTEQASTRMVNAMALVGVEIDNALGLSDRFVASLDAAAKAAEGVARGIKSASAGIDLFRRQAIETEIRAIDQMLSPNPSAGLLPAGFGERQLGGSMSPDQRAAIEAQRRALYGELAGLVPSGGPSTRAGPRNPSEALAAQRSAEESAARAAANSRDTMISNYEAYRPGMGPSLGTMGAFGALGDAATGGGAGRSAGTFNASEVDEAVQKLQEMTVELYNQQAALGMSERAQVEFAAELEAFSVGAGVASGQVSALREEYIAAALATYDAKVAQETLTKVQQDAQQSTEDMLTGFFNAAQAADSYKDALKRVAIQLVELAAKGALLGSGPFGGLNSFLSSGVSAVVGGLTGGLTGNGFAPGAVAGRAMGGPVQAGVPYVVGEHRPELFVPSTSGRIIPRVPSGGAPTITYAPTINAPGASAEAVAGIRAAMAADRARLPSIIQDTVKRAQKDRRL